MSRLGMKANDQYDVLVWAIGRKNFNQGAQFPPEKMKFKYILDLNYTDDSPGKELAFERGIDYISGASMFKAQANGQRIYWDGHP